MFLLFFFCTAFLVLAAVSAYAYFSGSCHRNKVFPCDETFCLYKEFPLALPHRVEDDIHGLLLNKDIQKRVSIRMFPETVMRCALPNKDGATISTPDMESHSEHVIPFYRDELRRIVSRLTGLDLQPTDLHLPTSCALLIYERENDWINWHYDHNYYQGRFFTVLIPITRNLTCTRFQFRDTSGQIQSLDLTHNSLLFEGNYLYHRATKLCKDQRRVMLSCQYVTDNSMSALHRARLRIKDFAYTGRL
jgi:hypothetical protein